MCLCVFIFEMKCSQDSAFSEIWPCRDEEQRVALGVRFRNLGLRFCLRWTGFIYGYGENGPFSCSLG